METRANYVAVGAFVLVVLAGAVIAVLWLARVELNREFTFYDIYFTGSVTGLGQGAAVLYNGIQIGRVAEIRLNPQDPQQVRVTIEVEPTTVIKSDAVASLESQGLTGVAYVEITGGTSNAPPLQRQSTQRYPVIASRPSGLQQVVTSAPEALSRIIEVADRLSLLFDDNNRRAIGETLENLRKLSGAAAARSGDIDHMLTDGAAAMHDLRGAIAQTNQAAQEVRRLVAAGGEGRDAVKALDQASHRLDALAQHLDAAVQENRPPLREFSQNGLNQLSQLMIDTRGLVANLTRITDEIERDPTRFFFGERRQGYQPR